MDWDAAPNATYAPSFLSKSSLLSTSFSVFWPKYLAALLTHGLVKKEAKRGNSFKKTGADHTNKQEVASCRYFMLVTF